MRSQAGSGAARAAIDTGQIEVIVTRPFNHTGPRQKPSFLAPRIFFSGQIALIERGQLEPVIKVGNMDPSRDVIDARRGSRICGADGKRRSGTVYNVASGIARPVRAIVEALVARALVPVRIEQDPSRFRPTASGSGWKCPPPEGCDRLAAAVPHVRAHDRRSAGFLAENKHPLKANIKTKLHSGAMAPSCSTSVSRKPTTRDIADLIRDGGGADALTEATRRAGPRAIRRSLPFPLNP